MRRIFAMFLVFVSIAIINISNVEASLLSKMLDRVSTPAVSEADSTQIDRILMSAVKKNDIQLAEKAIKEGANVNCYINKTMPLGVAIVANKNYDMANLLLRNGANVEGFINVKTNVKHLYIFDCDLDFIPFLLDWGVDVNIKGNNNIGLVNRLLLGPSHTKHSAMLKYLISKGVDIDNAPNKHTYIKGNYVVFNGETALMTAARLNDVECAKILLQAGANYKKRDNRGRTALDYAIENNRLEMINLLMDLPK